MSNAFGRSATLTFYSGCAHPTLESLHFPLHWMTVHSYQMIHWINVTFLRTRISPQTLRARGIFSRCTVGCSVCAFPSPVLCTHRLECEAVLSLPLQVHLVPSHSISVTLESFFLSFSPEGLSRAVYPQLASFPLESRADEHEGEDRRARAELRVGAG